jgi:hypothetical protein
MKDERKMMIWGEGIVGSLDEVLFFLDPKPRGLRGIAYCRGRPFIVTDEKDPLWASKECMTTQDFAQDGGWLERCEKPALRIFEMNHRRGLIQEICVIEQPGLTLEKAAKRFGFPILEEARLPARMT